MGGWVRRPRVYAALALPLAIPVFVAAVRSQPQFDTSTAAALAPPPMLRYAELVNPAPPELPQHSLLLTMERNDTLGKMLTSGGLSGVEATLLGRELAKSIDVRRLRPGHLVRFHYDMTGVVDAVQIKITGWGSVDAVRNGDRFDVKPTPAVIREEETTISGDVKTSLYHSIRAVGEGPQVVQQLIDIFQWDIDFFELQKGDNFSFVVTKQYAGNDPVGYGPITAARFTHKGITHEAFRHEMADGRPGYYTAKATPLRKQFLKAPLKFSRVTSGFTKRRFHPVLKYLRSNDMGLIDEEEEEIGLH